MRAGRGKRLGRLFPGRVAEAVAAGVLVTPYLFYNRTPAHSWVWQQPEWALRAQPQWAWAQEVLRLLWANSPALLLLSGLGLVVAALSASRAAYGASQLSAGAGTDRPAGSAGRPVA